MIRGEIWWADFGLPFGSETGYRRPVVIVQDNAFNQSKIHTVLIVPLSTNLLLLDAPGNVFVPTEDSSLSKDSACIVSQVTTLDKTRLVQKIGPLPPKIIEEIEDGMRLVLGL